MSFETISYHSHFGALLPSQSHHSHRRRVASHRRSATHCRTAHLLRLLLHCSNTHPATTETHRCNKATAALPATTQHRRRPSPHLPQKGTTAAPVISLIRGLLIDVDKSLKSFDWDDAKTTLVYNAWEMKAKIRYADYISRLKKNTRHVYIPPEIWTKWDEVWNSEKGKKKTELAKKNRRGGVLNGVAQSTHTTGSTPHIKVAAQLEQVATQQELLTENGEQVDDNQLYYDAIGGHDKKRRIYGLGSYGCSIVNGSTSDNISGNVTPTSQPPDNATSTNVQDEIKSLKATIYILLMQQRLDSSDGGRADCCLDVD
ncbi:uncharacterized protein LOC115996022 [Ipomoea triloba]|uniref:uncharacterized protein LOC115996022 n=1 Tax=Ipomoea triloba TaxID=35885 RepID=UPI00125DFEA1|nr:uncharacterized protein LOC115996022 [Ipomoea triloba]